MIEAFGLTSTPRKAHPPAVDDVTFEARAGQVTALLGEAGAGKTTTLRLMLELQQGRGLTHFRGRPLHRIAHPSREVGVVLGDVPGHPARSVRGHLRMLCAATGVPARRADEVLETVGIVSLRDERLGTLSRGMDRRLGLACALLADPHTLVLDEPTNGLAGREALWLHRMLRAHATQGGTVLYTTADPKEAARAADRVVTLEAGRLVADQAAGEFARTRLRPRVAVRSPHAARLAALLSKEARTAHRSVEVVREGGNRLSVYGSTTAEVGETAFRHGILVHQLADETGDMGPGADLEPSTEVAPETVRRQQDTSETAMAPECLVTEAVRSAARPDEPGRQVQSAAGSTVTPQPRASAAPKWAGRSGAGDAPPDPSRSSEGAESSVAAALQPSGSGEAQPDGPQAASGSSRSSRADTSGLSRPAEASAVALRPQSVGASAGTRPSVVTASAQCPASSASPDPATRTAPPDPASATVPAQPPAVTTSSAQPSAIGTSTQASVTAASAQPSVAAASVQPSTAPAESSTAAAPAEPPVTASALTSVAAAAVGESPAPAASAQPSPSAAATARPQTREMSERTSAGEMSERTSAGEMSERSSAGDEPGDLAAPAGSRRPRPGAVPAEAPSAPLPVKEPLQQPQPGKPAAAAEGEIRADATSADFPAALARRPEASAPDALSFLPPTISVRTAPSPLRPLRYELRRAAGIGAGFLTCGVVLLLSAVTAVLLARLGHTPQARLFAAWPRELPLPPAALGAGLLGALAFGDEFRHPALAADRGTVPRRLGLLTAKLLVSGATAVLLSFLTLGCDAEVLYLVYGRELAKVPADWLPLTVSWFGLVVGCSWAGVLAAGVFRSTTAGLAAVLAVPVLVVPAVHEVLRGPGARMATGLPARLREAFLLQWPFGGDRYLVGTVRMLAQPVGGALALSLAALLCAYLFTTLRARAR
ncbi:ATP-binding cassette domain-containing protein [Streptomyces arenae]|uniref:ABC transporter ATP-binding protein n=1 Tax=Streptomyces arenae TaxID=29301 RepID=UPI0026599A81|nr:ATP-binding cassette domain-containing protein [Streptomyces arenae]MCG7206269.1 ATP-binding cassette domain-containing protein [Streptomyces arenae]